jgi:hypothetical protein
MRTILLLIATILVVGCTPMTDNDEIDKAIALRIASRVR